MGDAELLPRSWFSQPVYLVLMIVAFLVILWLGVRLLTRRRRSLRACLPLSNPFKAHCWQATQFLDKPTYCNSCTQMCFSGSYCVSCGLCICAEKCCAKMASSTQSCKPMATNSSGQTHHHWVKGNLPLASLCYKCLSPCGCLPKLADVRCVWCQRTAHEECIKGVEQGVGPCNLGPHHVSIIPPSCVSLSLEGWRGRRRYMHRASSLCLLF